MVAAVFHRVPVVTHITVLIAMCVLLVLLPPNPPLYLTGLTTLFSCRLLFPNPVGPPSFSYIFNFLVTVRSLCNSPLNCICFPLHMPDMLLRSARKRLSAVLLNGQIALERFKEIIFLLSSFFTIYLFLLYMYECFACMKYMEHMYAWCLSRPKEIIRIFGTTVTGCCEPHVGNQT